MKREMLTATIAAVLLVAIWVVGFWYPWIHRGLALLFVLVAGSFPFWVIEAGE